MTSLKTRKNRAPLHLAMGVVGLIAICTFAGVHTADGPAGIKVAATLTLLVSLGTMFVTRRSDEYTLGLWSAGANAAFAVIVVSMLFAPFLEGLYDGFTEALADTQEVQDFSADAGGIGAILAFFIVFNVKRFIGAL